MQAFAKLQHANQQREAYARQWHDNGGKVVGYLCDNVPAELFQAAGMLPYRLSGNPNRSKAEINALLGSVHTTRLVGLEFIDAITASFIAGDLPFIDYLVVPHNRKNVQALGAILLSAKKQNPALKLPEFYYLDRTTARDYLTSGYNRAELMALVKQVEVWRGKPISQQEMRAALDTAASSRALLRDVNALRGASTPRISGVEALTVYGASHFMSADEFQAATRAFIDDAQQRPPLTATRLYLGGSPVDNTALYELIESQGAVIVAEDHCWGARCADIDVDADSDPFEALAQRFVTQPACSLLASIDDTTRAVAKRAERSGAQAAIFNVINGDKSQMWETPSQIEALKSLGMASLHLKRQPYRITDADALNAEVSAFLTRLSATETLSAPINIEVTP